MPKPLGFLTACTLAVALALPALAEEPSAGTVVARVNGEDITLGQMIVLREALPEQYRGLPNDVLFDGILDQLVQQILLSQTFGDELPKRVELSMQNERRALLANEAARNLLAEPLDEADVQAAYEAQYVGGTPELEYNASHILLDTEEDATAVRTEIEGGADFADMAKERSTGPSGPSGGKLGWFGDGQMVPTFEAAVKVLEAGQVSQPVQTRFGWHVILLHETRLLDAPPLESVRAEIEADLQRKALESRIESLIDAAEIDRSGAVYLDRAALSQTDLIED